MNQFFCNKCKSQYLESSESISCSCSAPLPIREIGNVRLPVFCAQGKGVNEFSIENAAEVHDNAMDWLHSVHGTTESNFRSYLVSKFALPVTDNPTILVTSAGAGNDLPFLFSKFPGAKFYVQDFAQEMLAAAIIRNGEYIRYVDVQFFVGDAHDLPFRDNSFDGLFHFGGLNLFANRQVALGEGHRVLKDGGFALYGDEGLAPWMYQGEIANVLTTNNPLYSSTAPIDLLPLNISDFSLEYLFNNCFYLFRYKKSTGPIINIDVEHKGRRGGSMRTRYFGALEGIDPDLRNALYKKAESDNVSRVSLIERFVKRGLGLE